MMKLYVAFDESGRIVAASEIGPDGGDRPAEQEGLTVAELDVPADIEGESMEQYLPSLVVDVQQKTLKRKDS